MIDDFIGELRDEISSQIRYSTLGYSQGNKLVFGGVAGEDGGSGGPPAGIVGKLVQRYVAYDTTESATLEGSDSLVDNLNHIRARITLLENSGSQGGGNPIFKEEGYLATASGVDVAYLTTASGVINKVYLYCEETGDSGSTTVDININGSSIFESENRPELTYDSITNITYSDNITTSGLNPEDIITLDIDSVATGAQGLAVVIDMGADEDSLSVLWDNIVGKPSEYPPESHTHLKEDITDLEYASSGDVYSGIKSSDIITASSIASIGISPDIPNIFIHYKNIIGNTFGDDIWIDTANGINLVSSGTAEPVVSTYRGNTTLYFNGVDSNLYDNNSSYVNIPRVNSEYGMSVLAWVKIDDINKEQYFVHKDNSYELICTATGNLRFNLHGNTVDSVQFNNVLPQNTWCMVWASIHGYAESVPPIYYYYKIGINDSYTETSGTTITKVYNSPYPTKRILSIGCKNEPSVPTGPGIVPVSYISSRFFGGYISEIILCGGGIDADEAVRYYQYTRGKYGV